MKLKDWNEVQGEEIQSCEHRVLLGGGGGSFDDM